MGLFGFGKKKEEKTSCCYFENSTSETIKKAEREKERLSIKVLGGGCSKCKQLEKATLEALKELRMNDHIEHVTDFTEIATYGVMATPSLVVDGKVVSCGRVLSKNEIVVAIKKMRG